MTCHSRIEGITTLCVLLLGVVAQAAEPFNVLIVDLYLNQQDLGETFVLGDKDGHFFVDESVLQDWQISRPWPQPVQSRGKDYYGIHEFAGASAELNLREMKLDVEIPPSLMPTRTVGLGGFDLTARAEDYGGYLDYEVSWLSHEASNQRASYGLFRPVLFGKFGNISANTIYRNSSGDGAISGEISQSGLSVLELTYTRDDPQKLRSLRIGDIFAIPGPQGRALRMGGIQLATNFETQPSLITSPLPKFYGQTAVPTSLDIYVNGQLARRQDVLPGSYVLENIPVVNGAGQLQVIAHDAFGRPQVFTQDFYSSTELLRLGLSEYSVDIGALREAYGIDNFKYGNLAASTTWRHGLRENLTIEGHGEFTNNIAMIGGAAQYAVSFGGTLSGGIGLSTADSGPGARWQLGFRQQNDLLNYNVDVSGSTQNFALVGDIESPPKMQFLASAGKNFYEYGSLGLSVVQQSFHGRPQRTIVSASHSTSFNHSISLSTHLSYVDAEIDNFSIGISFSMPFGRDHYASGGFSNSSSSNTLDAEVSRSLPAGSGYGYHVGVSAMDYAYIDAGMTAQSRVGTYRVDVRDSENTGSLWQLGAGGSVAYMSGMTQFTRQVRDAFAVVNVGNIEGVRVYAENQEIGRTDKNGQLFVPGLRPYLRNNLSIEIADLPLSANVGNVASEAAPYFRSGVVVDFEVRVSNNVMLRAVLPNGDPVPEGAFARINYSEKMYPVGRDGKLFLQGIDRSSLIRLRWADTSCELDVPFPSSSAVIAKMGDIVCEPRKDR